MKIGRLCCKENYKKPKCKGSLKFVRDRIQPKIQNHLMGCFNSLLFRTIYQVYRYKAPAYATNTK
jgi:hypothetical protein